MNSRYLANTLRGLRLLCDSVMLANDERFRYLENEEDPRKRENDVKKQEVVRVQADAILVELRKTIVENIKDVFAEARHEKKTTAECLRTLDKSDADSFKLSFNDIKNSAESALLKTKDERFKKTLEFFTKVSDVEKLADWFEHNRDIVDTSDEVLEKKLREKGVVARRVASLLFAEGLVSKELKEQLEEHASEWLRETTHDVNTDAEYGTKELFERLHKEIESEGKVFQKALQSFNDGLKSAYDKILRKDPRLWTRFKEEDVFPADEKKKIVKKYLFNALDWAWEELRHNKDYTELFV